MPEEKHKANTLPFEPPHDKTNKMACAPSEDADQPGHPPSLIRVFAVRSMGNWGPNVSSCRQRRPHQTGRMLRLIWVFAGRTCHFVGFVMRRLISEVNKTTWKIYLRLANNCSQHTEMIRLPKVKVSDCFSYYCEINADIIWCIQNPNIKNYI